MNKDSRGTTGSVCSHPAGKKGPCRVDRNDVLNNLAAAIEDELGDRDEKNRPFLPLSVRYAAAEAALTVVETWRALGGQEESRSDDDGS